MARPIVLSNGEMHVGINNFGLVHDFYYPYVGLENHSAGKALRHRVGVWVDGEISWLDNGEWRLNFLYPHQALIGHTEASNERLGIVIEFDDAVDADNNLFMRNIHVVNHSDRGRDIRLFMHQAFVIGDTRSNTDTAQYLPVDHAVLHYRGRRAFIVSGTNAGKPFDQYTMGLFDIEGREGTYRDADDGELNTCNVEHGRVDSTIRFALDIEPHSSKRVQYWIAAGESIEEATDVHRQILKDGIITRLESTAESWKQWLLPAQRLASKVDPAYYETFIKSVMVIKSQIDKRGAIIASTDTSMLNYSRDAYGYSWPRDGAYIVWPLIRMGFKEEPLKFFEFCLRGLHKDGYLMHKYQADGAIGSSWHPYLHPDGNAAAPIQEDETALVLFVFAQYYQANPSEDLLKQYFESLVTPMANFMTRHIDSTTGLPAPSYDLWEEVYLTTTYSTSVTYAALLAAAELAEIFGDADSAVKWRSSADDIYAAAHQYLYNKERKAFYKGLLVKNGEIEYNSTFDMSSVFGAFMFGLFPVGSEELDATMNTLTELFGHDGVVMGLPRYENDNYQRTSPDVTGNYWFICSLWCAQYYIETKQPDAARRILEWVTERQSSTGILSEQINPVDGAVLSVSPLTWSHAEYIATLLDTISEEK